MDDSINPTEATTGKKHPQNKLDAAKVRNAKPGRHADGNGLYLVVSPTGAKKWVLRTVIKRKRCDIGLGGLSLVSLKDAREEAARLRRLARKGGDPLAERRQEQRIIPTFEAAAREVYTAHSVTFRNAKHSDQWITTLETYAFPIFGNRRVDAVEPADILAVLTPIWLEIAETARRVKQRLNVVFDYARAKGWRTAGNPVDGIAQVLPKTTGKSKKHHSAMPYGKVPEFLLDLQGAETSDSIKLAFEFLILTAARTNEVILARWDEIDLESKAWTIPAERMKAKREHRVPLSPRCLEILKAARALNPVGGFVFPGRIYGKPLSNMAFLMALRRMEKTDITAHGFRSSFRDWAEERTGAKRRAVESSLAHSVGNKVEAAYLRTDLFDERRRLMNLWAAFCLTRPSGKVVMMREA